MEEPEYHCNFAKNPCFPQLDVAYKMVQAVANMSSDSQKKHYFGEIIKLSETMNGNVESLQGLLVENLLDGYFSMYHESCTGQQVLSTQTMKRAEPAPA
jgi:hypothetical protein